MIYSIWKLTIFLQLHFKQVAGIHLFLFLGVTSQKAENYCTEGMRTLRATKAPLTYNWWTER